MLVFESPTLRHIQSMLCPHWLFFMVHHRLNEKNWCHPNTCSVSFVMLESAETKKPGHKLLKNKTSQGVYQPFWKLVFTSVSTVRMRGVLMTAMVPHCERTLGCTSLSFSLVLPSWRKDLQRFSAHVVCPTLVGTTSVSSAPDMGSCVGISITIHISVLPAGESPTAVGRLSCCVSLLCHHPPAFGAVANHTVVICNGAKNGVGSLFLGDGKLKNKTYRNSVLIPVLVWIIQCQHALLHQVTKSQVKCFPQQILGLEKESKHASLN